MKGNRKMKREELELDENWTSVIIPFYEIQRVNEYLGAISELNITDIPSNMVEEICEKCYPNLKAEILINSLMLRSLYFKTNELLLAYQRSLCLHNYGTSIKLSSNSKGAYGSFINLSSLFCFEIVKTTISGSQLDDLILLDKFEIERNGKDYLARLRIFNYYKLEHETMKADWEGYTELMKKRISNYKGSSGNFDYRSWSNRMNSNYLRYRIGSHRLRR